MVTSLEVIDSAVKIGLGALITGIGSYFVARLNLEKDRAAKRREVLEDVAGQVEELFQLFITSMQYYGDQVSDAEHEEKFDKAKKDLPSVEAKLLLLGEKRALKSFRNLRDEIFEHGGRKDPYQLREDFFDTLSDSYRRLK